MSGGRGGRGEYRGSYDPKLDEVFAEWKAREGNEGIKVQLISYDGAAPKVKMTRYYLDNNDEWQPDAKRKFPRFGMQMLAWLMQATGELEKGMEAYKRKHGSRSGASGGREKDDGF